MEQFPPFRSFVMCVPRSKGFLETPFDMDAEGLPTAAKKGWNRKMFEQWFEEAKTLGLIFFNYKGPIVTIKGHEVEYDAKNPSQSKPKEVNGTAHPNVRAHTQCTFKDDKKLSDCPAVTIAGFYWWDLRDSCQDYIPIVFYGKTVPNSTQHLSARNIVACEHPHDNLTPPEPPYVSAHFFPFSFTNLLST